MSVTGRVVSGKVELDEPLPEGAEVRVSVCDEGGFELTEEAEAELLASMAEGERGESIPLEEALRSLKTR